MEIKLNDYHKRVNAEMRMSVIPEPVTQVLHNVKRGFKKETSLFSCSFQEFFVSLHLNTARARILMRDNPLSSACRKP